jgi:hypothetical protein
MQGAPGTSSEEVEKVACGRGDGADYAQMHLMALTGRQHQSRDVKRSDVPPQGGVRLFLTTSRASRTRVRLDQTPLADRWQRSPPGHRFDFPRYRIIFPHNIIFPQIPSRLRIRAGSEVGAIFWLFSPRDTPSLRLLGVPSNGSHVTFSSIRRRYTTVDIFSLDDSEISAR